THTVALADIQGKQRCLAATAIDGIDDRLAITGGARRDHRGRTLVGQRQRDGLADAATAAGDNGNLAFQILFGELHDVPRWDSCWFISQQSYSDTERAIMNTCLSTRPPSMPH